MRKVLFLVLSLALSACGVPMRWEKTDADEAVMRRDLLGCRVAAREEAMRSYRPYGGPLTDPRYWLVWRDRSEFNRFVFEENLARFCMRNKGYAWVAVPQPT